MAGDPAFMPGAPEMAPAAADPMGMTDFAAPGTPFGTAPMGPDPLPVAPGPVMPTINDAPAVAPMGFQPQPAAYGAPIPAPPPKAAQRSNAALFVGVGSIAVAVLGVVGFIVIRSGSSADDEAEAPSIALPTEPAPVAVADQPAPPVEPPPPDPAATDTAPPPPAQTTPPQSPPGNTKPPGSSKPPGSATPPGSARPPGSAKPPGSSSPGGRVVYRPSKPSSGSGGGTKPSSGSGGGGGRKPPKLVRPKK